MRENYQLFSNFHTHIFTPQEKNNNRQLLQLQAATHVKHQGRANNTIYNIKDGIAAICCGAKNIILNYSIGNG